MNIAICKLNNYILFFLLENTSLTYYTLGIIIIISVNFYLFQILFYRADSLLNVTKSVLDNNFK